MAGDFGPIREWVANVADVTSGAALKRILDKAGMAGKKAALEAAAQSLGSDRRFSGWARGPALNAGYDLAGSDSVVINFRGPWKLAEQGRRSHGTIRPKRRRAVLTPSGPRARSSYGRSRGLNAYTNASRKASVTVPKAAHDQFVDEIRKVIR
jgi:hypothetical protein